MSCENNMFECKGSMFIVECLVFSEGSECAWSARRRIPTPASSWGLGFRG